MIGRMTSTKEHNAMTLLKTEDRAHHLDHYLGDDSLGLGLIG